MKRKGCPEEVANFLMKDKEEVELIKQHLGVLDFCKVKEGEEIEVKSCSGSGSLFSLSGSYKVLRGSPELVDVKENYWSAGAASSSKTFKLLRMFKGCLVRQHYSYDAAPSTEIHYLRYYYVL